MGSYNVEEKVTEYVKEYFERRSVKTEIGPYIGENGEDGWTRGDSNPGPPARKAGVLPLNYGPSFMIVCETYLRFT